MLLIDLEKRGLISPPHFLPTNTHYLCRMGSVAYGVSTDNSDLDIYGVTIPPKDYIFPENYIEGFDERNLTFKNWQKHHIKDPSANGGKGCSYDFSVYNIVDYFSLAMDNNPNVIDSLFVRREHVIHSTRMWEMVRENRRLFLHKGVVHKMKGYAFSQLQKAKNCATYLTTIRDFEDEFGISHDTTYEQFLSGQYECKLDMPTFITSLHHAEYQKMWEEGLKKTSRFEQQKIAGFDRKFMYHVFRLVDQAEYILNNHDLDLQEPGRAEKMKAIRRGDIPYEKIVQDFHEAETRLASLYESSTLRHSPPKKEIRALLVSALEDHYGSIANLQKAESKKDLALREIRDVLNKYEL